MQAFLHGVDPLHSLQPAHRNCGILRMPALIGGLLVVLGCHAQPMGETSMGMKTGDESRSGPNAQAQGGTSWTAQNKLARVEGTFAYDHASRKLQVRYVVSNIGEYPLLVFDRGDTRAVSARRQSAGSVANPQVVAAGNGDVTLNHVGRPLTQPSPTVPASPLVTQILPGAEYANAFVYIVGVGKNSAAPRRIRYCQASVGVPDPLPLSDRLRDGVWKVPNNFSAHQGTLCTPWFVLASGTFAGKD